MDFIDDNDGYKNPLTAPQYSFVITDPNALSNGEPLGSSIAQDYHQVVLPSDLQRVPKGQEKAFKQFQKDVEQSGVDLSGVSREQMIAAFHTVSGNFGGQKTLLVGMDQGLSGYIDKYMQSRGRDGEVTSIGGTNKAMVQAMYEHGIYTRSEISQDIGSSGGLRTPPERLDQVWRRNIGTFGNPKTKDAPPISMEPIKLRKDQDYSLQPQEKQMPDFGKKLQEIQDQEKRVGVFKFNLGKLIGKNKEKEKEQVRPREKDEEQQKKRYGVMLEDDDPMLKEVRKPQPQPTPPPVVNNPPPPSPQWQNPTPNPQGQAPPSKFKIGKGRDLTDDR